MSLIPSISFIENNVGYIPINQNIRNRIGIVSTFSRGSTTPTFITGDTFFDNNYGSDTTIGSLAYQVARDQGAQDFMCVRVLGNAKSAKGNVTFTGIANKANTLEFNINFIGDVIKLNQFEESITTQANSSYTGSVSGRYFFKIVKYDSSLLTEPGGSILTQEGNPFILETNATGLLYKFVNLAEGDVAPVDWSNATGIILNTETATSVNIQHGVVLKIGTIGQTTSLNLSKDVEFKVRVNAYNYTMSINEGDIPYQLATSFISNFSGIDALGELTLNSEANGVVFNLDSTNESIIGNIGNRFHYSFNISNIDILKGNVAATIYNANKLILISNITSHTTESNANNNIGGTNVLAEVTAAKLSNSAYAFNPTLYYRITFASGITTTPALGVNTFMSGGEDGPRQAYRDFYSINGTPLLRLQANYVGDYGNNIKVTLYPDSNNQFRLVISDLNANNYNPRLQTESYTLNFNDLDAEGRLNQLNESIYVNGLFLPKFADPVGYNVNLINQSPVRLAPVNSAINDVDNIAHANYYGPNKLVDISLENGYDGPAVTDNDYIKAINSLESQPVHLLIVPGVTNPAVQQHLISHCDKASDKDGLRRAILSCKPRLSPNSAKSEISGINSQRAVKVVGWSSYGGQPNAARFSIPPDAIYAGKRAATPYFISVHARSAAGSARNLYEVDTVNNSNSQALQLYTDARLEVLQVDPASQSFYFTSGRTTSTDPSWAKEYYRGTYDVIRQDLYDLLSFYIGAPHTLRLRSQIKVSVESYLRGLQSAGEIANYKDVYVDSINNPPGLYATGTLNVEFSFQPIEAVDYIVVSINRNTEDGLNTTGI